MAHFTKIPIVWVSIHLVITAVMMDMVELKVAVDVSFCSMSLVRAGYCYLLWSGNCSDCAVAGSISGKSEVIVVEDSSILISLASISPKTLW